MRGRLMVILTWLKTLPIRPWMLWAVVAIATFFYAQHLGSTQHELDQIKKDQVEQKATRKKVEKANEKIKSNPDFISDWLRDNGYFRD